MQHERGARELLLGLRRGQDVVGMDAVADRPGAADQIGKLVQIEGGVGHCSASAP
jgi:hypothetical protein